MLVFFIDCICSVFSYLFISVSIMIIARWSISLTTSSWVWRTRNLLYSPYWISSTRLTRVRIEESFSTWCNTSVEVPQGCVLSPLLFTIFIDSISKTLLSSYQGVRRRALAKSLLLPILDYRDVSYLDITEEQLDKLERVQNFCIRFVFGSRKYDHVSEFCKLLKWLPTRLRRNSHILFILYSIVFNPFTPPY